MIFRIVRSSSVKPGASFSAATREGEERLWLSAYGPTPSSESWKIASICAIPAAFRLAYTIFDVSQNALISLLTLAAGKKGTTVRAADRTIAIQAITSIGPVQASAVKSGLDKDLTGSPLLRAKVVIGPRYSCLSGL
jgi:hypothetical protein